MFVDTEVRPQGEKQQVGKLKLSEAIRIGAKLSPPGSKRAWRDRNGGTCAVMAAYEGIFGKQEGAYECPGDALMRYYGISLSDWHGELALTSRYHNGESREAIAAWLESKGL